MRIGRFEFGSIQIDGVAYEHDVVIDGGSVHKAKEEAPKHFRTAYGHTPLSAAEDILWNCRRLMVGAGAHGALPIIEDIEREAQARHVELVVAPTEQAIEKLVQEGQGRGVCQPEPDGEGPVLPSLDARAGAVPPSSAVHSAISGGAQSTLMVNSPPRTGT